MRCVRVRVGPSSCVQCIPQVDHVMFGVCFRIVFFCQLNASVSEQKREPLERFAAWYSMHHGNFANEINRMFFKDLYLTVKYALSSNLGQTEAMRRERHD